jgi:Leucine-rich repeat (LRR) protein
MSVVILGKIYNVDCKELYINFKKIITLSNSIGNLINLELLDLHYNKITTLPDSICNLINLKKLDLSDNQITSLPD